MLKKIFLLFLFSFLLFACSKEKYNGEENDKKVVALYCQSCHQLPTPDLLDKKTWGKNVLPKMGALLGIKNYDGEEYDADKKSENSHLFPSQQLITIKEWRSILRYFLTLSPSKLPPPSLKKNITVSNKFFRAIFPFEKVKNPLTIFVKVNQNGKIYFADAYKNYIFSLSEKYLPADSISTSPTVVNMIQRGKTNYILHMGSFYPTDKKSGFLTIDSAGSGEKKIISGLTRPVFAELSDLNNDKIEDIIICNFGFYTGSLDWYQNKNGDYIKHPLNGSPGAIHVVIHDFNADGKPDILALMAQGNEGFDLYTNLGNNNFSGPARLLSFPPSFGSNYFELIDFDNDGHNDIIASNGDNGDYPPILKNYHGVRIYINDGKNNFKEKYFYPMNGVHKVIPKDFDRDGDIDMAAISYFPDYNTTPEESFIFFENNGGFDFNTFTFSGFDNGRWITMDAGDIDHDGDIDILLGPCIMPKINDSKKYQRKWTNPMPPVLILENKLK